MPISTEYCKRVFDGTHDTPKPTDIGYRLITSKNILSGKIDFTDSYFISEQDYLEINKRSKVQKWDILFSMIGTVGNVCIIQENNIDFAIKNMGVFSCGDEEKAKWLYFFLQSPYIKKQIENYMNGAVQKFLPLGWLRSLEIPAINDTRRKISNLLWEIEQKIRLNEIKTETLTSLAKDIYNYWFVQFDFPDENGKPYKSSGGKMVWNEQLKREIPEGWNIVSLKDKVCIERGISYSSEEIESGKGIPMINLGSIDTSRNYKPEELKYYDGKVLPEMLVRDGAMLIACTDLTRNREIIGSPILVPADGTAYVYSMDIACLRSIDASICDLYLYMSLRTDFYHDFIKNWASGTNVLHLDLNGLFWYPVLIPPVKLQQNYSEIVKSVHKKKSLLLVENKELKELRDWLLPMLMNGQVKVR